MPGTSIGARLIAARERSDLSLESIADKTNMPLRKLEALENDEITTDNFTAFDKAYLKKYCQFIGVVYDDLFSDLKIKSIKIDTVPKKYTKPTRRRYKKTIPLKSLLITGCVIVMAYYFYSGMTVETTEQTNGNNHLILDSAYNQNL
ncbi:MAG: helix-turn-helix domain-containing protein [Pseudomonadota bacterium]|nr:helix-turn-helix domain-containing protein [Pseudomonadota bacterium]